MVTTIHAYTFNLVYAFNGNRLIGILWFTQVYIILCGGFYSEVRNLSNIIENKNKKMELKFTARVLEILPNFIK